MGTDDKVLIIIPAFNEEQNLESTVSGLQDCLKIEAIKADIIVINDASRDSTSNISKKLNLLTIDLSSNLGIGGAVQTGYIYAKRHGYGYALQFDGDGQHDPSSIVDLLAVAKETDFDLIIGSRFVSDNDYRPSLPRRLGMKYSSFLLRILFGADIKDTTSGFRLASKRMISVFAQDYPDMFAGTATLAVAKKNDCSMHEIPAKFRNRKGGKSSINFLKSLWYPFQIFLVILSLRIGD